MDRPATQPSEPQRILVADDEPHIRRILVTLLEDAGLQVDAVRDGTEALEALEGTTPYALVLSDLMMPGTTGLGLLAALKRLPHRHDTPVVILTAKGQDTDRREALARGARDFVTKPFSPKRLLAQIRGIIDS